MSHKKAFNGHNKATNGHNKASMGTTKPLVGITRPQWAQQRNWSHKRITKKSEYQHNGVEKSHFSQQQKINNVNKKSAKKIK